MYLSLKGVFILASIDRDLTQGSVTKQLIRYAMPLVTTSLLQSLYSIADYIVAGFFINSAGQSAINNSSLIMNLMTQITIGLTLGGNILIGQYFGNREDEPRKQSAGSLVTLSLITGTVTALLLFILSQPLLILLKAPALAEATAYMRICALGMLPIFGYNACSSILRAVGNSKIPLYCIIASTAANVVLDVVLVAVFDMGVKGAALATLFSQCVSFLAALIFCLKHRAHLGLTREYLRPRAVRIKAITRLGLPTAFQWAIASISWLVVAYLINGHGDISLVYSAANGASNKIKDFCQLFISAMSGAASTMIAQNLGAGLYDRARKIMQTCMKVTLGMAGVFIVICEILAPILVSFFTPDPEVQHWAAINLRIEIIGQLFYAGFFTYNTLATGCGDTMFVMWNSFVNCIIFRLILAIIFNHFWGIWGVFIACAIAPASSVPIGWFYCKKGYWKKSLTNRKAKA